VSLIWYVCSLLVKCLTAVVVDCEDDCYECVKKFEEHFPTEDKDTTLFVLFFRYCKVIHTSQGVYIPASGSCAVVQYLSI